MTVLGRLSRPNCLPGYGTIYLITNTLNGKQYVGQTIQVLSTRWRQHLYGSRNSDAAISRAIRKHGKENFRLRKLSRVDLSSGMALINKLETDAIQLWGTLIPVGYNVELGGGNRRIHESTKVKISRALQGHAVSEVVRARSREVHKGNQYSKGRAVSAETRIKLSQKLKGRFRDKVFSPETRAKISAGLKGRPVSAETRARISAGKKGHPSNRKGVKHTEQARVKMSRSHTGVQMSAERRANMCAAQKLRRANERAKALGFNPEQE